MGLEGAALATAASPIISILICSAHFFGKRILCGSGCTRRPSPSYSGRASLAFRHLWGRFLPASSRPCSIPDSRSCGKYRCGGLRSDRELCACGNGNLSTEWRRGAQPIVSDCYGRGDVKSVRKIRNLGLATAFGHRGSAHRSRLRIYGFAGESV